MNPEARAKVAELSRMVTDGELQAYRAIEKAMQYAYDDSRSACNKAAQNSVDEVFRCGCAHAAHEVENRAK